MEERLREEIQRATGVTSGGILIGNRVIAEYNKLKGL